MAGQLHFYYPLEEGSRFLEESTHSCIFGVAKRNYEIHILFEWRGIYVYYDCSFTFQIYILVVTASLVYQYRHLARIICKMIPDKS